MSSESKETRRKDGDISHENGGASAANTDHNWSQNSAVPPSTSFPPYKTANEYAKAVQQWVAQYHMFNQMQYFHASMAFYAACSVTNSFQSLGVPHSLRNEVVNQQASAPQPPRPAPAPSRAEGAAGERPRNEFMIPRIWKRVSAEFIDFFILFIVKLAVTIMTVEYVGIIDFERYDIELLMNQELDYNAAFAITSELVAMEIINRIFICIFETLCLRRGVAGIIGGATPGKRMMGLKVVSCETVTSLGGQKVHITPAENIGWWNALVRSVIKNFSLAFFFPVCFTVFFFQHNRAAYDVISNCLVVEATEEDRQLFHQQRFN